MTKPLGSHAAEADAQPSLSVRREKVVNHSVHLTVHCNGGKHLDEFGRILIGNATFLLGSGDGGDGATQVGVGQSLLRADGRTANHPRIWEGVC